MTGMFTTRPVYLMGIVNVTPDSFSDGGDFAETATAIAHARTLVAEGADIIDIGGESTRPGASPLAPAQEQARVIPVITGLSDCGAMISIDTRNASTMRAGLAAGTHMLNDVSALTHDPASMAVAASATGPICLMHMQGTPQTMQHNPAYADVVTEVVAYLEARIEACVKSGIAYDRLVIDPGFGFGKTFDHNKALLEGLARIAALGPPVLVGLSRKRFVGTLTGLTDPKDRVAGSVQAALTAHANGARILRVHDVAATRAALLHAGLLF